MRFNNFSCLGMNGLEKKYNLVIVGAGLSGSVIAERASKLLGLKVIIFVDCDDQWN